ncbi:MAG TPA: YceI family protein [Puia sp.]|jgi:polyisoprenoid-binding protein YceI
MATVKWTMDPTHSEVQFKVRHLMISNVTGSFPKFDVEVETQDLDFMTAKVKFRADTSVVTTQNEQRDQHLRSADFFDSAKYPSLSFVATRYEKVDNDSYELYGDLTIRDITKNIKLDVEFGGVITDPWGNTRAGFTINGKINRKDFGLVWNALTEAGGLVVGDEARVHVEVELIRQA